MLAIEPDQLDHVAGGDARYQRSRAMWDTVGLVASVGAGTGAAFFTAWWLDWRKGLHKDG